MSKINLLTPDNVQGKIVCIRSILNHPDVGYSYLTVLVDNQVILLFFQYPDFYQRVMIDLAVSGLPVHSVQFEHGALTFHPTENCPCMQRKER